MTPTASGYDPGSIYSHKKVAARILSLKDLISMSECEVVPPRCFVCLYGELGERDRTFEWIERRPMRRATPGFSSCGSYALWFLTFRAPFRRDLAPGRDPSHPVGDLSDALAVRPSPMIRCCTLALRRFAFAPATHLMTVAASKFSAGAKLNSTGPAHHRSLPLKMRLQPDGAHQPERRVSVLERRSHGWRSNLKIRWNLEHPGIELGARLDVFHFGDAL